MYKQLSCGSLQMHCELHITPYVMHEGYNSMLRSRVLHGLS